MTDCYFAMSAEQFRSISPHSATLIIWAEAKTPPPAFATEAGCSRASPGASARGPARQLGKFYEMMLNRGRPLLMRQTVEALVARHRAGIQDLTFKRIIDWGLGFIVNSAQYSQPDLPYGFGPHASLRSFGHGGNQSSIGFADPENALAAVIVFSSLPGEEAHQRRMVRILAAIYEDLKIVPPAAV
jgi:CubicO group peptidase (beta-lactamase class C family)